MHSCAILFWEAQFCFLQKHGRLFPESTSCASREKKKLKKTKLNSKTLKNPTVGCAQHATCGNGWAPQVAPSQPPKVLVGFSRRGGSIHRVGQGIRIKRVPSRVPRPLGRPFRIFPQVLGTDAEPSLNRFFLLPFVFSFGFPFFLVYFFFQICELFFKLVKIFQILYFFPIYVICLKIMHIFSNFHTIF